MTATSATTSIRLPAELNKRVKDAYWNSVEAHRLSYNAWLCKMLEKAITA